MKKLVTTVLVFFCVLGLFGCNRMDNNNNTQYFFSAKVMEVDKDYLLLEVFDTGNTKLSNGTNVEVSTDVIAASGCPEFVVDEYARVVMARDVDKNSSKRLEALSIYKTDETGKSIEDRNKLIYGSTHDPNADNSEYVVNNEGEGLSVNADYPAAIMVNDVIYYLSHEMPVEIDESAIIGYTISYTDVMPRSNGETNFNRELNMPIAKVEKGIAVLYNNEWVLCFPK